MIYTNNNTIELYLKIFIIEIYVYCPMLASEYTMCGSIKQSGRNRCIIFIINDMKLINEGCKCSMVNFRDREIIAEISNIISVG
jgi:hypothetical protein